MPDEPIKVDANPVKDFFIDIITRDVDLIDTIPEFVDNSIDGANRLRDNGNYSGLFVEIDITPENIQILDNCGGIPREHAENYAFRFGRSDDFDDTDSIIGEFGVGMKRSLFKLGSTFIVESLRENEHFVIEVDVDEWKSDDDDWNFELELIDSGDPRSELTEPGTRIFIEDLKTKVADKFAQDLFRTRLANELASEFQMYLKNEFQIILNGDPLRYTSLEFLQSDEIESAYKQFVYETEEGSEDVTVEMRAGLGDRSNEKAGWYIFCNGRLVLKANQDEITGWTGDPIPKFHGEFNRFRGMVNFKSDDPGLLPWNTTKNGVNSDSRVYQRAKNEMENMMRPVIDTLNEIANQKKESGDESSIEAVVEQADSVEASDLDSVQTTFSKPEVDEDDDDDEPEKTTIQYSRPKEDVEKVKASLGVETNYEVGEGTFDYFYRFEVGE